MQARRRGVGRAATLPRVTTSPGPLLGAGRTAEVYALGDARVVKLLRPGFPDSLGEAEAVAAELTTNAGLEVPRFHGTIRVAGRLGLVYEHIEGPSMLEMVLARPWTAWRMGRELARLHAAMHDADGTPLPDIRQAMALAIGRVAAADVRDAALRRLDELPDASSVLHGDFHPANVLMTDAGPRIIDWLTAASGPAAADVARTLLLLRDTPLPRGMAPARRATVTMLRYVFARTYLAAYRRARPVDPHELTRWRLPILVARLDEGIAEERVLLTRLIAAELSN